jgi:hypothetical protein
MLNSLDPQQQQNTSVKPLQNELDRALNIIKQKRAEIIGYQAEIERLKTQNNLNNQNNNQDAQNMMELEQLKAEIENLHHLIDELNKEKIDFQNDLNEKNARLDQMLDQEEGFQQLKTNLEQELFNKQQHIEECEKMIENLHQKLQNDQNQNLLLHQFEHEKQQLMNSYEAQLAEYKLKVTNKEHEIQKVREMYIEVCNDKNNLEDTLKIQFDKEYELKMKQQMDKILMNKLDEQKLELNEKFSQERFALISDYKIKLENLNQELQIYREKVIQLEKDLDSLKIEKTSLDLNFIKNESEMREKLLKTESDLKKKEDLLKNLENNVKNELTSKFEQDKQLFMLDIEKLNTENVNLLHKLESASINAQKTESDLKASFESDRQNIENSIRSKFELEKQNLVQKIQKLSEENSEVIEKLNKENQDLLDIQSKYENLEQEFVALGQSNDANVAELRELDSALLATVEKLKESEQKIQNLLQENQNLNILKEKINEQDIKLTILNAKEIEIAQLKSDLSSKSDEVQKFQQKLKLLEQDSEGLGQKMEQARQAWSQERAQLLAKKEEELKKVIDQLEKRFEDDYARFMQTHKEGMHRALQEKSLEYSQERDKLIEMYQKQMNDMEKSEQALLKQLREKKLAQNVQKSDAKSQTDSINPPENASNNTVNIDNEYINSLLDKIKSLEEVLGNTDAHFELEIEKLRQKLDEEYQIKLEFELEKSRITLSDKHTDHNSSKEKELEDYRLRCEEIEQTYRESLKKFQQKYEQDLKKSELEMKENYKQILSKSSQDIEQMQNLVKKLKKANLDSNKVIETLKLEMMNENQKHLNELTNLKMQYEREKENSREDYEKSLKKIQNLEQELSDNDEHLKKQCELLRAELKLEYGNELSKVNAKMKDMMKSHANAIEMLKKQHQTACNKSFVDTRTLSCQVNTFFVIYKLKNC